jgi:carbon-monoxide dehydrogenase catalytic subunit
MTKLLTEDVEGLLGGRFMVGDDPVNVANMLEKHIEAKRKKLGLT